MITSRLVLDIGMHCVALLLALTAVGCGRGPAEESSAAPATAPATITSKPPLRCGDVLSAADLTALGIDASGFDPNAQTSGSGAGANCNKLPVVTLFRGEAYAPMIAAWKETGIKSGIAAQDGPSVGGASQWTLVGNMNQVMFQSANRKYAASISGTDRGQVEKLARVLSANMEKH
jgi:hypothetical protein